MQALRRFRPPGRLPRVTPVVQTLNTRALRADDQQVSTALHTRPGERGFTLVEVMVAATILIVGVLGLVTMLDGANRATSRTKAREAGVNLAREAIEAARAVPYPEMVPAQAEAELRAQPGLADASADPGWQVRRRDIVYTLAVNVCSVDDGTVGADGYGDHTGGFYCTDSATQGATDTNPDDYKRVTLDVTWKDAAQTRTARQEAVINNPGSAFAPAIRTLVSNPLSPITNAAVGSVAFTATSSSRAVSAKWSLDNILAGDAVGNGAGITWTWTWNLAGVVDGTYLIGAEAHDQFGESGTGRVLTMVLNRAAPAAPTGLTGGRNALWGPSFAEFEWDPNPERDVTGYRLYRMDNPAAVPAPATDHRVCETSVDDANPTFCQDTSAPAGLIRYYAVALAPARVGTGIEESAAPALGGVYTLGTNQRPDPPASVTAVRDADGTTLTWTTAGDPDGSIRYYRVYRDDNTVVTARIDRTSSDTDLTLSDAGGAATSRRYWVTAVDDKLAESDFAPPEGIMP